MKKYIFILIIIISIFLRFYDLGNNPPSLTWDEAAWGYNAYSLGFDGKDEFGRFLPIDYIESFGDFKPVVYAYLAVIPVKIFGLTEFATRFPSAFFGVLSVILTYLLTLKIFKIKEENKKIMGLIASFVLAISPWHILLSRAAFEANIATFFLILGVYLFLVWENGKRIFLMLSLISFVLSMYTFNTSRIVSPILLSGLLFWKRKELFLSFKYTILSFVPVILLFLPLGIFLISPQAKLRFNEVNIFSDSSVIERINVEVKNDNYSLWSKFIHNRRFTYSVEYIKHYFDNLNPSFLFIKGDGNPKFSIQDVGEMYIWEIPFFIIGFFLLFRKREGNWWIIPYWLFIGIIPAATARETPHALRIETTLPTFQLITAYGIYYISSYLNVIKKFFYSVLFVLILFNFAYFYHNYFSHYSKEFAAEWQYGYRESLNYVKNEINNYDAIYFTDKLGRPYIYSLFYLKYNPEDFRREVKAQREVYGFVHVNRFGKYVFSKDIIEKEFKGKRILYVDAPENISAEAFILDKFLFPNGEIALEAFTK